MTLINIANPVNAMAMISPQWTYCSIDAEGSLSGKILKKTNMVKREKAF